MKRSSTVRLPDATGLGQLKAACNTQPAAQGLGAVSRGLGALSLSRWPMGQVPVEMFELITSYLSRAEVKTLRLVCREFENKVSAQYFRNVVVPFRAGLYSSLAPDKAHLFSSGMRIFQSFGPYILRFALALEMDEDALAFPPVKTVHKAVPSFWGIYRWPHEDYRRYQDLERIELTADETDAMKEALRCLSKVRNLGLCCDAGLGFLGGPERAARTGPSRHPVFASRDWRCRQPPSPVAYRPVVALSDYGPASHDAADAADAAHSRAAMVKRLTLAKMVGDAGYTAPDQVGEAVRVMLMTEGTTVAQVDLDGRSRPANDQDRDASSQPPTCPLIPSNLTMAQMEMLLELEWAHRAMIQSYVIGLIDNASGGCFDNVTTLTVAKIPSSHLHILCRHDLWVSIPSLRSVSLGVIADWRCISAPSPGFVQDRPVSPVQAVGKAFALLNSYIGQRPNIESIHFEWICGGELAPGPHHRNMHILPAPFFEDPELMAIPTGLVDDSDRLLDLPHAMHLSLKNCWAAPHVLLQTVRRMALSSLEKLELESVSLSGPPTVIKQASIMQLLRHQPPAHAAHAQAAAHDLAHDALADWMGLGPPPPMPGAVENPAANPVQGTQPAMEQPDLMSWPGIIEHFSPGVKIQQLLAPDGDSAHRQGPLTDIDALSVHLPDARRLQDDGEHYHLTSLSFKSCGYAALDLPYLNSRAVLPRNAATLPMMSPAYRPDTGRFMQRSGDKMMGLIVPYIKPQDLVNLGNGFGMVMGCSGVYDESVIMDAVTDGMEYPGLGRFSGIIEPSTGDSS